MKIFTRREKLQALVIAGYGLLLVGPAAWLGWWSLVIYVPTSAVWLWSRTRRRRRRAQIDTERPARRG